MHSLRKSWCQLLSQIVSPFAKTPDWSVRFAIVSKTARFARCHCSFYSSAFQVPSLLNSSLDPCPRVRLSAPADVAKHNYSTGPAGAKSTAVLAQARIGQSRTNGARSLRKKSEKMDRWTRSFLSPRDTRVSIRTPAIDDIERPSRATTLTSRCWIFYRRTEKLLPTVHFS